MPDKITKDNKLNEVITKYPQTRDVFIKHGMPKYVGRLPSENLEFFCKTCREMDIGITEIAVNPDQVHIFFRYPPKYSLSLPQTKSKEFQVKS